MFGHLTRLESLLERFIWDEIKTQEVAFKKVMEDSMCFLAVLPVKNTGRSGCQKHILLLSKGAKVGSQLLVPV